ncbi:MAG: Fis family transcriptional regulator [Candidatus Altiarchaeota archaeon]|nr:Fis family transcriptional regulator [Candidatus Altiarchaeota archaeon]
MMQCEVSSRKILPAIRRELVIQLVKTGKKQNEVARLLHVTPAAVTQYIKGKRAKTELTDSEKKQVSKIASKCMKKNVLDEEQLCSLCKKMQKSRLN